MKWHRRSPKCPSVPKRSARNSAFIQQTHSTDEFQRPTTVWYACTSWPAALSNGYRVPRAHHVLQDSQRARRLEDLQMAVPMNVTCSSSTTRRIHKRACPRQAAEPTSAKQPKAPTPYACKPLSLGLRFAWAHACTAEAARRLMSRIPAKLLKDTGCTKIKNDR